MPKSAIKVGWKKEFGLKLVLEIMKKEFWSMFKYGSTDTICSKHKTLAAARKEAKACEKKGGTKHWILEVRWVK